MLYQWRRHVCWGWRGARDSASGGRKGDGSPPWGPGAVWSVFVNNAQMLAYFGAKKIQNYEVKRGSLFSAIKTII